MRDVCGFFYILATLSPGVLIILVLVTGTAARPLYLEDWCAVGWVVIVFGLIGRGFVIGWREGEREHRRRRGLCRACGYDLRTTPTRCPECGQAVADAAAGRV